MPAHEDRVERLLQDPALEVAGDRQVEQVEDRRQDVEEAGAVDRPAGPHAAPVQREDPLHPVMARRRRFAREQHRLEAVIRQDDEGRVGTEPIQVLPQKPVHVDVVFVDHPP